MIRVETLHHVAVCVMDIERSKHFYGVILGLPEIDGHMEEFEVRCRRNRADAIRWHADWLGWITANVGEFFGGDLRVDFLGHEGSGEGRMGNGETGPARGAPGLSFASVT